MHDRVYSDFQTHIATIIKIIACLSQVSQQGPPTWTTEVELSQYRPAEGNMELVIAGAGPSGLAVADRVSQAGHFPDDA